MELFVIIINGFQPLTIITKSSIWLQYFFVKNTYNVSSIFLETNRLTKIAAFLVRTTNQNIPEFLEIFALSKVISLNW